MGGRGEEKVTKYYTFHKKKNDGMEELVVKTEEQLTESDHALLLGELIRVYDKTSVKAKRKFFVKLMFDKDIPLDEV